MILVNTCHSNVHCMKARENKRFLICFTTFVTISSVNLNLITLLLDIIMYKKFCLRTEQGSAQSIYN